MICDKCGADISKGEEFNKGEKLLCEDCYIETLNTPKPCDVTAVHAAKIHRAMSGQTGTDGLTELQKNIYQYIKAKGKATKLQIINEFNLSEIDANKQFAILRHCELVKARKEGLEIFLVCFDS